ncbi:MAG TPA: hypothetical protein DDW31_07445 [candidate division Zixibacteria bacterium]|nr:hypothetical protein [candidate division Zixibacteria bacterium]
MKLAVLFLCAALLSAPLWAATAPGAPASPKNMSQRTLNINAWNILTTNYGPFVNPAAGSGGYWGGPGYNYIYGAGVWFAGTTPGVTRGVACGYNPNSGQSEMGPVNPYTESYENWQTDPQARVYLSTNPVDVLEWPLRENGSPVIKSMQDSYCKYSDQNPQYNWSGSAIVGVVVEQVTYAWNYADNNDIVFFFFNVKNKNDYTLTNCRIAPCVDADIGNEAGTSANDRTAFDYHRNLAMQFQSENEPGWPRTGVVGFRFFQGPVNNTGAAVNIVDDQYPHSIAPGQPLGMTAFKIFTIDIDPQTDEQKYLTLEGYNYQTMLMDAYDQFGAESPGDKRFVQATGPFILGPDSIVTLCVGTMAAWDTASLKTASDVAQAIYDNGFVLAAPPAAPALTAVPGDAKVYLSWNKIAETNPDPYHAVMDSAKGWFTYFKGSWFYCADKTLVDSFEIKTGSTTSVRVARGAANPSGGTDTLYAFYSQKAMYCPYDFQAYALYRAASQGELLDPDSRTQLGVLHTGSSGARSYNWDKVDGIQIVRDINTFAHVTPETTYYLPVYDTLGTDCGLAYGFVDQGLTNGLAYWYGLSAIDYQPNVYFTRKAPTTLASSPADNSVMAVPVSDPPGSQPAGIQIRVDVGCQATTDYWYNTRVVNPTAVPDDSFKLYWQPVQRAIIGTMRHPVYRGHLHSGAKALLDSLTIIPNFGWYGSSYDVFYGPSYDELPFGGIVFQPFVAYAKAQAVIDSLVIIEAPGGSRTYPRDSVSFELMQAIFGAPNYYTTWQWRGSDFEIRWKDTLANSLTAQVWDLDNDVEAPLEAGVTKGNMVQSSWCFNPLTTAGTVQVDSGTSASTYGMHIAGLTVYFNKAGATLRRMTTLWPHRPETGDIWRVYCSGPKPPHQGGQATVILSPAVVGVAGGPDGLAPDLVLAQNLPNPFTRTTTINYQLTRPGLVSLKVYNVTGQLVRTLVDGTSPSAASPRGEGRVGSVSWDGRDERGRMAAAGVYLYQLRAGDKALTRKMVLVR